LLRYKLEELNSLQNYIDNDLLKVKRYSYDDQNDKFYEDEFGKYGVINYTVKTQFKRLWDDLSEKCRGIVVNLENGDIINNVMPKFFNYGEPGNENISGPAYVTEKYDGSMVSVSVYDGILFVASRSTLNNYVTDIAREIIKEKNYKFSEDYTYMFELITPRDKHIVNYDFEDLVLLCVRSNHNKALYTVNEFSKWTGRKIKYLKIEDIKAFIEDVKNSPNVDNSSVKEGYVLVLPGDKRVKVKYEQYCVLHKLLSDLSPKFVFESLSLKSFDEWASEDFVNNACLDILRLCQDFPDEQYKLLEEVITYLKSQYDKIYLSAVVFNKLNLNCDWVEIMKELQRTDPSYIPLVVAIVKHADDKDRLHKAILKKLFYGFKESQYYEMKIGKF